MAKKPLIENPFEALEQDAYHAYREWHIWLVLRLKQLEHHLKPTQSKERK